MTDWNTKFEGHGHAGEPSEYDHGSRTYLEPGELKSFFPRWEIVDYWEGLGPEHRHGDGPVERHGLSEAVFRTI